MDRAEQILLELVRVAETLGLPVEIDRRFRISLEDIPLIVVRTGEEELSPPESAKLPAWDRRWVMRPGVEIYLHDEDDRRQRAELSRLWLAFLAEFKKSRIVSEYIPRGYIPEIKRDFILPNDYSVVGGLSVDLGIVFER